MRLLAFLLLPGSLRLDFDSPAASVTDDKVVLKITSGCLCKAHTLALKFR
jgi:hypothetical protein